MGEESYGKERMELRERKGEAIGREKSQERRRKIKNQDRLQMKDAAKEQVHAGCFVLMSLHQ